MIKTMFISFFLLVSIFAKAQTTDPATANQIMSSSIKDTVYSEVDTPAMFPGGKDAWIKFIEETLDPSVGVNNGAEEGKYNVIIKFIVAKDSTLKNFKPETKYGYGLEKEVIRVLKKSPKWIPAKKNGVNVSSFTKQNQVFNISVD